MATTEETEAPAERYRRLAATLSERVAAVPADRWEAPSPCSDWSARDVLRHVVEGEAAFVTKVDLVIPDGPTVDDDPAGAWEHTRSEIQAILDDPEKADREYDGGMGRSTIGATLGTFFCVDLVVHGWDIAHATGVDDTIPAEDIAFVSGFLGNVGDAMRGPGGFGPAVDTSADADEQTKLLGFLGRSA